MINDILQYTGSALAVIGALFVAYKKKIGWIIWLFTNALLIIYSILTKQWGIMMMYIAYLIITTLGLINLNKK